MIEKSQLTSGLELASELAVAVSVGRVPWLLPRPVEQWCSTFRRRNTFDKIDVLFVAAKCQPGYY